MNEFKRIYRMKNVVNSCIMLMIVILHFLVLVSDKKGENIFGYNFYGNSYVYYWAYL